MHVGQWNHLVASYEHGVKEYVVVNGVRSLDQHANHSSGNRGLRLGSPFDDTSADVCVSIARVYDIEPRAADLGFSCREGSVCVANYETADWRYLSQAATT